MKACPPHERRSARPEIPEGPPEIPEDPLTAKRTQIADLIRDDGLAKLSRHDRKTFFSGLASGDPETARGFCEVVEWARKGPTAARPEALRVVREALASERAALAAEIAEGEDDAVFAAGRDAAGEPTCDAAAAALAGFESEAAEMIELASTMNLAPKEGTDPRLVENRNPRRRLFFYAMLSGRVAALSKRSRVASR